MADYWKSQARKYCDFCKCWIADNKPSIDFHEGGKKHKENVSKRLKEIHKNSAKQAKQQKKFESDIEKMEKAAMAAYLKDVENDTRDMTADKIIQEKCRKADGDNEEIYNPNKVPHATPEAHPRSNKSAYHTQSYGVADIDPLDPFAQQKLARLAAKKAKKEKEAQKHEENHQKLSKSDKEKEKKMQTVYKSNKIPISKSWYEARSQGHSYSYFWNIETNESIWEPPMEGYVSLLEQAEQAKEQAIQEEFLKEIDKEEEKEKEKSLEEQRANTAREKLKEVRKQYLEKQKLESDSVIEDVESDKKNIIYRRDYSVPDKPKPYGSWQVVRNIEIPKIDLQLPKVKEPIVPNVTVKEPLVRRVFKEKTVTHISTEDSEDEGQITSFKKRKFANKNVRKRLDEY